MKLQLILWSELFSYKHRSR